jgi:hypothetical protein
MKRNKTVIFLRVIWVVLFMMTSIELFHIFLTHSPFPVSLILVQIGAWFFAICTLVSIIYLILYLRKTDR